MGASDMFRSVVVLTAICITAALVLGVTYSKTKPLIAAQAERERNEALKEVLGGVDEYNQKSIDGRDYYEGYKVGEVAGYAIFVEGDGYAGPISLLVGIDKKATITGIAVLSHGETPGLGAKCTEVRYGEKEPWFLEQFKGKFAPTLELKDIDAITGATITSDAIVKSVRETVKDFFDRVKD